MNRSAVHFFLVAVVVTLASGLIASTQAQAAQPATSQSTAKATFAGGCFWCMEPPYDKLPGVISTTSGYMGGRTKNPTYEQVTTGATGHTEVVQVEYDPSRVSYAQLLEVFWRNIDPTQRDGQFCDHGSQYRTAIFYHGPEQQKLAAGEFYRAEEYHQDFYKKNPARYKLYRTGCGRDARLQALWGRAGD
jgi:peptide-methionine (S)-S-oxide reductase